MKIGLVSQWFDPEPGPASLPGELARELVRRGHDVQVVTGFPNYPAGKVYPGYRNRPWHDEVSDRVKIRRVGLWPSHDGSALGRVANYTSFGASASINGFECLRDRDAVWVSNSPPTVVWLTQRLRRLGVPIALHVLDLWPDNIESSGMVSSSKAGSAMLGVVNRWNTNLYRDAARVLTISPSVSTLLVERGVPAEKVDYCPLWANETLVRTGDSTAIRRAVGVDEDTLVILYAGAIGEVQGLGLLVNALSALPAPLAQKVECWFVGDGVWESELEAAIELMPPTAPRLRAFGRKPMSEIADWVAASDICFVGLKADDHARYTMPSKVQSILAMGKPILAAVPGDVNQLVAEKGIGFSTESDDPADLTSLIEQVVAGGRSSLNSLGNKAKRVYEEDFSLSAGVSRIEATLAQISNTTVSTDAPELQIVAATEHDLSDIVVTHQRSFPGFFLTFLGPRFLRLFYEGLLESPDAVLLVVKRGDRIVGFVGGVHDETEFFAALKRRRAVSFARAAAVSALREPSIIPRLLRARNRDAEKEDSSVRATLLSIAVEPEEQGLGTAKVLLDEYTKAMSNIGVNSFTLTTDLSPTNRAVGFYENYGFIRNREFTTAEGRPMVEFLWSG